MDLLPTLLETLNIQHPGQQYKGRELVPLRGKSILPYLQQQQAHIHAEDHVTGWELFGQKPYVKGIGKPCLFLHRMAQTSGNSITWQKMWVKQMIWQSVIQKNYRSCWPTGKPMYEKMVW